MRVLAVGDPESVGNHFGHTLRQAQLRVGIEPQPTGVTRLSCWRQVWDDAETLVLMLPHAVERGLATLEEMARENACGTRRIVVVGPADGKLVLRTRRLGASHYIDAAELESELEETLRELRDEAAATGRAGRLIAVLGPSGGSGASTLAVNLAATLASEHGQAGLVDLKLGAGVLEAMLALSPRANLADFCRAAEGLDPRTFEQMLTSHSSGVQLLAAPSRDELDAVSTEGIRHALAKARARFPHVIVDVDRTFAAEQLAALREADVILMPLRLDFASVRNAYQAQRTLEELEVDPERIRLIASRFGQPRELPREKAELALGGRFFHALPEDAGTVHEALHQGIPLVVGQPKCRLANHYRELARNLSGWESIAFTPPARRSWLKRLTTAVQTAVYPQEHARHELARTAS